MYYVSHNFVHQYYTLNLRNGKNKNDLKRNILDDDILIIICTLWLA